MLSQGKGTGFLTIRGDDIYVSILGFLEVETRGEMESEKTTKTNLGGAVGEVAMECFSRFQVIAFCKTEVDENGDILGREKDIRRSRTELKQRVV